MWARHCELMLGAWLLIAPFFLGAPEGTWVIHLAAGAVVIAASALCYAPRLERAHLVTFALALGLALYGWLQPRPVEPVHQGLILVGLTLAMFAVIPSHAAKPPRNRLARR